jgi:tRNA-2-methylthio-N6-dimethylallyladenosine synthase
MKRGYTALEFKSKIRELRRVRPTISITSDFIVGFPGETEEDFMKTMALVDAVKFDGSYSFIYSPRPGTPAADLPDPVPLEEKKRWLAALQTRLEQQQFENSQRLVGSAQRVLVTGLSKKSDQELQARTECNRVVILDHQPSLLGQFVNVTITAALPNALRGVVSSL